MSGSHSTLARIALLAMLVLCLTTAASSSEAANCKKGIPCGNSCIAASKTCHKNATPSPVTPRTAPPATGDVPAQITCPPGTRLVVGSNPPICRQ